MAPSHEALEALSGPPTFWAAPNQGAVPGLRNWHGWHTEGLQSGTPHATLEEPETPGSLAWQQLAPNFETAPQTPAGFSSEATLAYPCSVAASVVKHNGHCRNLPIVEAQTFLDTDTFVLS